ATAEGDDFAHIIMNREHDTATKPIVGFSLWASFISRLDQSALQNLGAAVTAIERPGQKCIPALGCKTDLPVIDDPPLDPSPFQIIARRPAYFAFHQILVIPFRGFEMELEHR